MIINKLNETNKAEIDLTLKFIRNLLSVILSIYSISDS